MPIYEYQCSSCGHEESMLEKMDAPRAKKCPACGGDGRLQRLVSAAGFRLKGSGWYQTDFKNSGQPKQQKKAAKDDSKADTDTAAGDKKGSASESGTDRAATGKDVKPKTDAAPA